jgi:ribosome-associated protein
MNKVLDQVIDSLESLKGKNIISIPVSDLTDVTDHMVIVTGTSNRHVKSLAENAITELKKVGHPPLGSEGMEGGEWVLVDFGEVVLHVMQPHTREFYDLERLWTTSSQESGSKSANSDETA